MCSLRPDRKAPGFRDLPLPQDPADLCSGNRVIGGYYGKKQDYACSYRSQPPRLITLSAVHELIVGTSDQGSRQPGQFVPQRLPPVSPKITGCRMQRLTSDSVKKGGQDLIRLSVCQNREYFVHIVELQEIAYFPLDPLRANGSLRTENDQVFAVLQLPA